MELNGDSIHSHFYESELGAIADIEYNEVDI